MNPLFKALCGAVQPMQQPMANPIGMMPNGGMGGILERVQQLANTMQNPQQLVARYFPDAPAEISGDPNQLLQWMQQTGKVNPQMVQMARQMIGGR